MELRTWITLAAVAGLLSLWLQRRDRQPKPAVTRALRRGADADADADADAAAAASARAVASHAPANTMSPALDHAAGLARGRTDDVLAPSAHAELAQLTERAHPASRIGVAYDARQQR
jgi:hypothetical protein